MKKLLGIVVLGLFVVDSWYYYS